MMKHLISMVLQCPNEYGASVIIDGRGCWEIAVLKDGKITYDTPVTGDVVAHLTWEEVPGILSQIEKLP